MIDDSPFQLGEVEKFGNPWHGWISGGLIHTASGQTHPIASGSYDLDTWYFKAPSLPTPTTEAGDAAQGMEWRNDAIFSGPAKTVIASSDYYIALGNNRWIYYAPSGKRWILEATLAGIGVAPAPIATTALLEVKLISEFGRYGQSPSILNTTLFSQNMAVTPVASGATDYEFDRQSPSRTIAHSPSGALAIVNCVVNDKTTNFRAVKLWRIDVTEPSPGTAPTVSVSVYKTESQCCTFTKIITPIYSPDGWGPYIHETSLRKIYIMCAIFGTSETPQLVTIDYDYRYQSLGDGTPSPGGFGPGYFLDNSSVFRDETAYFATLQIGSNSISGGVTLKRNAYSPPWTIPPPYIIPDVDSTSSGSVPGRIFIKALSNNVFLLAGARYIWGEIGFAFGGGIYSGNPTFVEKQWSYGLISPGGVTLLPGEYQVITQTTGTDVDYTVYLSPAGGEQYSWGPIMNENKKCDGWV